MPTKINKARSFFIVVVAYVLAFFASILVLTYSGIDHPVWNMAVADLAATVVIFLFSLLFRNSSIYDPYWSVFPIFIACWWVFEVGFFGDPVRNVLLVALVSAWGIRLTFNWARGWPGLVHEDWRYEKLAEDTGPMYWLVSFLGIHLFPTILVFLGCLPLYYLFQYSPPVGMLEFVATVVTAGAIIAEATADNQLRNFRLNKSESSPRVLQTGLWAYSRHPNYFGEITFWTGIFIFAIPLLGPDTYWLAAGMVSMYILFIFISIPMMEKREAAKEGYEEYKRRTSALIPWPPKKRSPE